MDIWGRCKKCNGEFLKEYLKAHEATCNGKAHLNFSFKPEVKPEKMNEETKSEQ